MKWFGNGLLKICTGSIDLDTDTFKVLLTTSAYTPDQDAHDFRNDVTNEVSGTGYTAGGNAVTVSSVTYDSASNQVRIVFADVTWPASTITARTAVIYKSRGGASSADELLAYVTEATDISSTGATFTLDFPAVPLTITAA
jgi:hypothetical protein